MKKNIIQLNHNNLIINNTKMLDLIMSNISVAKNKIPYFFNKYINSLT